MNSGRQSRFAYVLRAGDGHGVVLIQRATDVHHGGEMHYGFSLFCGRRQRLWPAYVTSAHSHAALVEPAHILRWQCQNSHAVTAVKERLDEMMADKAIASGNKY